MRGSIVFSFLAVAMGSLWFQSTASTKGSPIGIAPDGSPMYESGVTSLVYLAPLTPVKANGDARPGVLGPLPGRGVSHIGRN